MNRAGTSTVSNKRIRHGPIVAARDNTTLAHLEEQRVSTLIKLRLVRIPGNLVLVTINVPVGTQSWCTTVVYSVGIPCVGAGYYLCLSIQCGGVSHGERSLFSEEGVWSWFLDSGLN